MRQLWRLPSAYSWRSNDMRVMAQGSWILNNYWERCEMCCSHYNSNTPSQIQRQKIIVSKKIEEAYTKSILDSEMCFGLSPSASVRSTHCSGYLLGKLLRSILMYTVCLAFQVGCACAKNCQALFSWTSPPKQLAIIQRGAQIVLVSRTCCTCSTPWCSWSGASMCQHRTYFLCRRL